jgi:hypothetical protein
VLAEQRAKEIVDRIDLSALPICLACHIDLAFAFVEEKPRRVSAPIVTRTCTWVWLEIQVELLALVRRAAMRNQPWAVDAVADLVERGARSWIVREIVCRVAAEMARDMRSRGLGPKPAPLVLTFPRSTSPC